MLLIAYWTGCTLVALLAVGFRGRNQGVPVRLTILRKFFHGVIIAVYLPGVILDRELLFLASIIALAGFILLEAIRLCNFEFFGPLLNQSLSGFLDEKDQGLLILTHIYLLVGCSFPVWIFPSNGVQNVNEVLLLSSGIISLGVGDTAASIGGSLFGRTKFPNSSKSVEGVVFSVLAEIVFVAALNVFGMPFYSEIFQEEIINLISVYLI